MSHSGNGSRAVSRGAARSAVDARRGCSAGGFRGSGTRACLAAVVAALLAVSCTATFTGRISVKGSEPHTYLAIDTADHGELEIVGPLASRIRALYQGQIITVEGTVLDSGSGPGFPPKLRVDRIRLSG
ncbi:hypothetical protein [Salinispira pacifica]